MVKVEYAIIVISPSPLEPIRFQDFHTVKTFDIILMQDSINHLDEEACVKLQYDDEARKKYGLIFRKLSEIAVPGARLIITDFSRYNLFASLGVKNPFVPTSEWDKHQSPDFWSKMLSEYGFMNPEVFWTFYLASGVRKIGRLLLGNRFASYFFNSHFRLVLDKVDSL